MAAILWAVAGWFFREVMVKFLVLAALYWLLAYLVPFAIAYVAPFISTSGLTGLFAAVPDGVY